MAHLIELDGIRPTIGEDVFLAPTAVLIGNVHVGDRSSVWFGAVLRGDLSRIEIGERCSIQDTAVIHCAIDLPTIIGDGVTIGHGALLEGCTIEDGAVIGMGATVLQHAHVGEKTMIAAGGVVPERMAIAAGVLAAGVPVTERKPLSGSAARWSEMAVEDYQELRRRYLASGAQTAAPR
ncbi:MAG TPA: gamma carbonic anhydrase family protein [Solirubrobacteraceae bacterium]|jgi:carbonic anhydrase/acetyltransferase-like protein (isoleucine patch superfamily)|nr:gamma carbonic anhydrase family protein [Solirubrobacteraceae bacterium]